MRATVAIVTIGDSRFAVITTAKNTMAIGSYAAIAA